ncbi:ABC-2 family transporter protein [Anaerocolumna sp. AGMB13020]|uniref:ABC transporter permease n=1 Tax=Anaerocolumna sp. AGMB13020 TaxID=3081750 RepID=UPI002952F95B|nr:ABC-2 family transporter protein [Anaerocolumna sp. AGMB13020]WOO34831.1 ABC-2 family transporter protein [Anaerocolumna sp. AGMB13020]
MNNRIINQMGVYKILLNNSFRQRYTYASGVWIQMLGGILFVFMQGSLWTALIQTGYTDVTLKEMISYVVINAFVSYSTGFNVTSVISDRIQDGMIAIDLILPVKLKWKLFFENIGGNIFDVLFSGISGLITALILYGAAAPVDWWHCIFFVFTVLLGVIISYQIIYIFGLSAFWIVKPWYISILVGGLAKLFGGGVIPLWLYPDWLLPICEILPFRFISYEPIQIYIGNYTMLQSMRCILMQVFWLLALMLLEKLIWTKAGKKVFVQGG